MLDVSLVLGGVVVLNLGLSRFGSVVVVTVFAGTASFFSSVGGMLVFREFSALGVFFKRIRERIG